MRLVHFLRRLRTRWTSLNLKLLRLFLRVVPFESHRVFAVALAAGADGGAAQRVSAIAQSSPHIQPDDTLVRAVVKMERSGSRQLAVVDPGDGKRLLGLLTMSDVVRAHARAAMDADAGN